MTTAPGTSRHARAAVTGSTRRRHAVPPRLVAVWGVLFLNVLAFGVVPVTIVTIPKPVGQVITQAALGVALLLAVSVNPRAIVRPNLFLGLLTMLGLVALMVAIHSEFLFGSTYRGLRFLGFVAVLWLLTPWWGRPDMLLLRCHRRVLWVIVSTAILGVLISPGLAFAFEGRLAGVVWPIPPTQLGHYSGVLTGTTAVLWMCRVITGRHAAIALAVSGTILIGTHTRTALLATVVALGVASASLFLGHVRVRRVSALAAVGAIVSATLFASQLTEWILRGQSSEEASQLTGRTKVWSAVLDAERPKLNELFGSGLSDQSFNGLPIDNSWFSVFWDQGWFGIVVQASIFLLLLLTAATRKAGPQRGAALFLIVYCLVASLTETGLGTASAYMLDLAVAAALLAPEAQRRRL